MTVVELAYTPCLKRGAFGIAGSNPAGHIKQKEWVMLNFDTTITRITKRSALELLALVEDDDPGCL